MGNLGHLAPRVLSRYLCGGGLDGVEPRLVRGRQRPILARMTLMSKLIDVGSIACYFESLSDPRHTRNRKHLLVDIIVIAVAAIVCGCDGPTAIHRWATHHSAWLAQHLQLANGIPS